MYKMRLLKEPKVIIVIIVCDAGWPMAIHGGWEIKYIGALGGGGGVQYGGRCMLPRGADLFNTMRLF